MSLSRADIAALTVVVIFAGFIAWLSPQNFSMGIDFKIYYEAAQGVDYSGFFYPEWFRVALIPLTWLPLPLALFLWQLINIAGFSVAAHVFERPLWFILLTYYATFNIFFGNATGVLALGLALACYGTDDKHALWHGVGGVLLLLKPQFGIPLYGLLWWHLDDNRSRALAFVPGLLLLVVSFASNPAWIMDTFARLETDTPAFTSASLWQYIGAASLVLWLPLLLIKDRDLQRSFVLTTAMLAVPFSNFMTVGLLPLVSPLILASLAFVAYFRLWIPYGFLLPMVYALVVYGWCLWQWWQHRQSALDATSSSDS